MEGLRPLLDQLTLAAEPTSTAAPPPAPDTEAMLALVPGNEQAAAEEYGARLVAAATAAADEGRRAALMQVVAELAKEEGGREALAGAGAVAACVAALQASQAARHGQGMLQALRATGNLCVDHDANRKQLLTAGGLPVVAQVLASLSGDAEGGEGPLAECDAIRLVSTGAMLNAAAGAGAGSDDVRKSLIGAGAVSSLVGVFKGGNAQMKEFALRAIHQFAAHSDALQAVAAGGIVPELVAQFAACSAADECEDLVFLLRCLADSNECAAAFLAESTAQRLLALSNGDSASTITQTAGILVSMLLSNDQCLGELYTDGAEGDALLATFVCWMQQTDCIDMQVAGALCVGNIARSDATARRLAQAPGVVDGLLALCKESMSGLKHAGLGSLKNIAILAENKPLILAKGGAAALMPGLEDSQAVLQYGAATLLRSLCLGQPAATVLEVARHEGLIPRLVHLTKSEELATRSEATRCLATFVKHAKDPALNAAIIDAGGVASLVATLASEPDMLQPQAIRLLRSEAVLALTGIALQSDDPTCGRLLNGERVVQALNTLMAKEGDNAPTLDILCNGLSLGATLVQRAPEISSEAEPDVAAFQARAQALAGHEHATVKQQSATVSQLLAAKLAS